MKLETKEKKNAKKEKQISVAWVLGSKLVGLFVG